MDRYAVVDHALINAARDRLRRALHDAAIVRGVNLGLLDCRTEIGCRID
jgi:hypothetical protein